MLLTVHRDNILQAASPLRKCYKLTSRSWTSLTLRHTEMPGKIHNSLLPETAHHLYFVSLPDFCVIPHGKQLYSLLFSRGIRNIHFVSAICKSCKSTDTSLSPRLPSLRHACGMVWNIVPHTHTHTYIYIYIYTNLVKRNIFVCPMQLTIISWWVTISRYTIIVIWQNLFMSRQIL